MALPVVFPSNWSRLLLLSLSLREPTGSSLQGMWLKTHAFVSFPAPIQLQSEVHQKECLAPG